MYSHLGKICFHGTFPLLESGSDQVDETDQEDGWKCLCPDWEDDADQLLLWLHRLLHSVLQHAQVLPPPQLPEGVQADCCHNQTLLHWSLHLCCWVCHCLWLILLLLLLHPKRKPSQFPWHQPHRPEYLGDGYRKVQLWRSKGSKWGGSVDFLCFLK